MFPESSPEFRTATPDDAESIRDLVRSAYAKWIPVIGREPRPMVADYAQAVRDHRIDLLFLNSRLAGLIETMLCDDHLWIENVAVGPEDQGKGLGRRLLAHAERMAAEAGRGEIRLLTNAAFEANIALYESAGYRIVRREPFMGGTTVYMSNTIDHKRLPEDFLTRRVEEACLNGWPALREIVYDGWLIRLAEGHTRRTNSVNLLTTGTQPLDRKIEYCETVYAAHGLPTIFCIPSTADPALGRRLDERGYGPPEDESCVLFMNFAEAPLQAASAAAVLEEGLPGEPWLETLARLHHQSEDAQRTHRKILANLAVPAVFAAVPRPGDGLGALAFGAVHDGLVCVNSVVTQPDLRRQGLARKAVSAVLAWAQDRCGATGACLSVVAGNAPARALYAGMGFTREMYRYHYRRSGRPAGLSAAPTGEAGADAAWREAPHRAPAAHDGRPGSCS